MRRDNNELKERSLAALRADTRLEAATLDLDVDGRDGVVALTGTVRQPWEKFYAQRVLERLLEVDQVENLVLVELPMERTDEEIAKEVMAALVQDKYLDERTIEPHVEEGVVYLRGRVPTLTQKRLAGVIAWWRAGVRDVINELEVERPEPDTNEMVAEAVKVVLEKDPLVDGSEVAVHVAGEHEVTLTGAVRNPEEREAAENDAWCVVGVRNVENWLGVVPPGLPVERFEPGR